MPITIHPELQSQLDNANDSPVQAIVQLREPGQPDATPSPEKFAALAKNLLDRVQSEVGQAALRINPLRNLATLIVEAHPGFLRKLVQQPEVISAIPNQTAESPFIPPKGKRPA
jgi:hypothetical protein